MTSAQQAVTRKNRLVVDPAFRTTAQPAQLLGLAVKARRGSICGSRSQRKKKPVGGRGGGALCGRHVGGGVGDGGGGVGRDSSTVHCVVTIRSPSRLATDRGVQPDPHPWAANESVASLAWMGGGCCVGRGGGTTFRGGRAAAGVLTRLHAGRRHRCRGELLPRSPHPSAAPPSVTSSAGGWVGEREGLTAEASDQQAETSDQQAETSTPGRMEGYLAIKIALPDKQFGLRTPPTDSNLETYLANQEHHSRDLIGCYPMGPVRPEDFNIDSIIAGQRSTQY